MRRNGRNLTAASIWRLVWLHKTDVLLSWDLWLAVAGAMGAIALEPKPESVVVFACCAVGVTSAIIGIVLAGLAIVTAFLDRQYVAVLDKAGYGIASEVFCFRYPAALAVVSVALSAFLTVAKDEGWYCSALGWLVPLAVFFFLYTLFVTLNLVAAIGGHMMNRSLQLTSEDQADADRE